MTWQCDEHFETSTTPRNYGGAYTASCDAPGSVTTAGTCIQVCLHSPLRSLRLNTVRHGAAAWPPYPIHRFGPLAPPAAATCALLTHDLLPGSLCVSNVSLQVDCAINALDNATSAPLSSLNHGETATWTCNSGFKTVDGSHQGIYTAICGDSGVALTAPDGCTQVCVSCVSFVPRNHMRWNLISIHMSTLINWDLASRSHAGLKTSDRRPKGRGLGG